MTTVTAPVISPQLTRAERAPAGSDAAHAMVAESAAHAARTLRSPTAVSLTTTPRWATVHRCAASSTTLLSPAAGPPHAGRAPKSTEPAWTVSKPDSPHEREADRIAEAIGRGDSVAGHPFGRLPGSSVARQEMAEPDEEPAMDPAMDPGGVQQLDPTLAEHGDDVPFVDPNEPDLVSGEEEAETGPQVSRKMTAGRPFAVERAGIGGVLAGGGRPLESQTRRLMQSRFGRDLSQVRVHVDGASGASALALNARAYTVGSRIVFAPGEYRPGTPEGLRLLAHELTHVVQQPEGGGAQPLVQRKILVAGVEPAPVARRAMVARNLKIAAKADVALATSIVEDMAVAKDVFDFTDEHEFAIEIAKRVHTVVFMKESQPGGAAARAFGYPFTGEAALYGPRVNYAAKDYWQPQPPDGYQARTDKKKNADLLRARRRDRWIFYGDPANYSWKLTATGKADPYSAIVLLFVPQIARWRSLLHCDYLASLVHFRSFADTLGKSEFNKRIAAFGAENIVLRWNLFDDLEPRVRGWFQGLAFWPKKGLDSLREVRPSSEADLVIGDHVVFFNHIAYDLINRTVGEAWRLENAFLISKDRGGRDVFLGHGSGELTADGMRGALASRFNEVLRYPLRLTQDATSRNAALASDATKKLKEDFSVRWVGTEWRIQDSARLCRTRRVDMKLPDKIGPSEVVGLRDPCDETKMYPVRRPIESAKGRP